MSEPTPEQLLPCPFCGGKAKFTRDGAAVGCTNCWAEGPCTTPEGVAAKWNTRVLERPSDEAVELTANERELVELLRREGRHSKVWFADQLLSAADLIERLAARAAIAAMQDAKQMTLIELADGTGGQMTDAEFLLKNASLHRFSGAHSIADRLEAIANKLQRMEEALHKIAFSPLTGKRDASIALAALKD